MADVNSPTFPACVKLIKWRKSTSVKRLDDPGSALMANTLPLSAVHCLTRPMLVRKSGVAVPNGPSLLPLLLRLLLGPGRQWRRVRGACVCFPAAHLSPASSRLRGKSVRSSGQSGEMANLRGNRTAHILRQRLKVFTKVFTQMFLH